MASVDDAATVLDHFVHEVANLPAEIQHLLEEVQKKDEEIAKLRKTINQHDRALQKHVKDHGSAKHPKEDQYVEEVSQSYEKAQSIQTEKLALAEKASFLLDRHVKRLDLKIRDLENEGLMNPDPKLPSLLRPSVGNLVAAPNSNQNTGANTPLNPLQLNNRNSSHNIANAAIARMASSAGLNGRSASANAVPGLQPHPLLSSTAAARSQREMSAGVPGSADKQRRRLQASLGTLPNPSSSLARQSSLGPGTPKAGTPGSRAGSAGPGRGVKKATTTVPKKLPPHQQAAQNKKKHSKASAHTKKSASRRLAASGARASPSTTGADDDSNGSSEEDGNRSSATGNDGAHDDEDMEEAGYGDEGDDDRLYCICQQPSHGRMIACDNEKCPTEWFHMECVGMTTEPKGKWLCQDCRKLPPSQIEVSEK